MSDHVAEVTQTMTKIRSKSVECFVMQTSDSFTEDSLTLGCGIPHRLVSRRSKTKSPRPRGLHDDGKVDRTRGRSVGRRRSRRAATLIVAYSKKHRARLTVDALPKPSEDGEKGETEQPLDRVLRADSVSQNERRGRGYFRGVGNSFSTSAHRRRGRAPGNMNLEVFGKGVLFGRTLSPSPERI